MARCTSGNPEAVRSGLVPSGKAGRGTSLGKVAVPSEGYGMTDVATAPQPPVGETARLDVVVLGGAGHVGLPLSLAFADAGLRVGIFDIDAAALERIGHGQMPF